MWAKIIAAIKGVMQRMGLIKQIENVAQLSAVEESQEQYNRIQIWRDLYSGYLPSINNKPFHDVNYMTVNGEHHKRRLASMKMPKVVAEKMASLVFNQKCAINIATSSLSDADASTPERNDPFADAVQNVLNDNQFNKMFQRYLEYGFALGGMIIKPYFDGEKIRLSFITAENFLPIQSSGDDIQAGVFVNQTRKGDKYYTLLEWHQWLSDTYQIVNELYMATNENDLGNRVSLSLLYPDMDPEINITGLNHPLFVYIKPNIANNFETDSPLGISLIANSIDTLHSLDIAFDSFRREFILGKRRIIVPDNAIRTSIDPKTGEVHRYFDANDEVYQAMKMGASEDDGKIQDMATPLRAEDHIASINALLNTLAKQIGFSAGTFSFDGGGTVQTATQVISENSDTFRTKQSHETLIEQGIKELIYVIAELAKLYGLFDVPDDYEVSVDFDDSIAEDRQANANFYLTLVNSQMMPKFEAIKRIFNLTDEQAHSWIEQINSEQPQQPDVTGLIGQTEGS